jgi:NADH:ubiquinone oxidoreductase subunit C
MRISTYLFEEAIFYEREVYDFLDLIVELYGVIKIMIILF